MISLEAIILLEAMISLEAIILLVAVIFLTFKLPVVDKLLSSKEIFFDVSLIIPFMNDKLPIELPD